MIAVERWPADVPVCSPTVAVAVPALYVHPGRTDFAVPGQSCVKCWGVCGKWLTIFSCAAHIQFAGSN